MNKHERGIDDSDAVERFVLALQWVSGDLPEDRVQAVNADVARGDSRIFGTLNAVNDAVRPFRLEPPPERPAVYLTANRLWRLAAAVLLLATTIGFLAYHRQPSPDRQVALLEQRAKDLQAAPPDAEAVRKLRADLLTSPIEVKALAWRSEALVNLIDRTRPEAAKADEAGLRLEVVGYLAASQLIRTGLPVWLGSYGKRLYGSVWQYAGDTGRKLDPTLEDFLIAGRRTSVGMIIPARFETMGRSDRVRWDRLVALGGKGVPVKIVNTLQVTARSLLTKEYNAAIEHAHNNGVEVYAFVNCDGGLKSETAVESEVKKWHELFRGRLQGIYFDNQSMANDGRVEYFTRIFKFAKSLDPNWKIISATKDKCDEAFIKILDDNIICYKSDGDFPKFNGWENRYDRSRFAALIHNVDRLDEADFRQAASVFGWVYATVTTEPINRYKTLPPFLEEEAALLEKLNGTGTGTGNVPEPPPRKPRPPRTTWLDRIEVPPPSGRTFGLIAGPAPPRS